MYNRYGVSFSKTTGFRVLWCRCNRALFYRTRSATIIMTITTAKWRVAAIARDATLQNKGERGALLAPPGLYASDPRRTTQISCVHLYRAMSRYFCHTTAGLFANLSRSRLSTTLVLLRLRLNGLERDLQRYRANAPAEQCTECIINNIIGGKRELRSAFVTKYILVILWYPDDN